MTTGSPQMSDIDERIDVKVDRNALVAMFSPAEGIFRVLNQIDTLYDVIDEVTDMVESAVAHNPRSKDVVLPLTRNQIYVMMVLSRVSLAGFKQQVEDMRDALDYTGRDGVTPGLSRVVRLMSRVGELLDELTDATEAMLIVEELDEALSSD